MHSSFEIQNRHGDSIRGDIHLPDDPAGAPVLLICHGFKGFKDWGGFPFAADFLATHGFAAVRFNFSLNGIGEQFEEFTLLENFARNTISRELEDLRDLIDAMERGEIVPQPGVRARVGLIGHSLGGGVAILHAAEDARVRGVVSWAGVADFMRWGKKTRALWRKQGRIEIENGRTHQMMPMDVTMLEDIETNRARFDIPQAAARIGGPLLVVHGAQDVSVPIEEGHRVAAAADPSRTRFVSIPRADHTFGIRHPFIGTTSAFTTVLEETVRHFRGVFAQD